MKRPSTRVQVTVVLLCLALLTAARFAGKPLAALANLPDVWKVRAATDELQVPTTAVRRGDVVFAISAVGQLQGGNSEMLVAPMTGGGAMAITKLRQDGELIEPGEVVLAFDTTEQEFRLREAEADLAEAEQQVLQAQAEAAAKEEETRYAVIQAKAELDLALLEIRRNPLLPRIVGRQNELAVEAAKDKLAQAEKDYQNRKATAAAGIAIHEAARQKAQIKSATARKNIEQMTVTAKTKGYVALQQNQDGNFRWGSYLPSYQIGDMVRPGMAVAQIPDMANLEISAKIGELDRGHIAEGQKVEIEVAAVPGKKFQGRVKSIGGTTGPPWERRFETRVQVESPIPQMRPGMSVKLRIVTGESKDVLWLPAQALFESDGRRHVFIKQAGTFTPKDVTLVRRNESQVVITGLSEHQLVAMANPSQAQETRKLKGGGAMQALSK